MRDQNEFNFASKANNRIEKIQCAIKNTNQGNNHSSNVFPINYLTSGIFLSARKYMNIICLCNIF